MIKGYNAYVPHTFSFYVWQRYRNCVGETILSKQHFFIRLVQCDSHVDMSQVKIRLKIKIYAASSIKSSLVSYFYILVYVHIIKSWSSRTELVAEFQSRIGFAKLRPRNLNSKVVMEKWITWHSKCICA